jgi:hypothetical protein
MSEWLVPLLRFWQSRTFEADRSVSTFRLLLRIFAVTAAASIGRPFHARHGLTGSRQGAHGASSRDTKSRPFPAVFGVLTGWPVGGS